MASRSGTARVSNHTQPARESEQEAEVINDPAVNSEEEDEDDIVASFDMFIKPNLTDGHQIYVLQFPNRDRKQPYTADHNSTPIQLRTKPQSGMVELDVPIDTGHNYDKDKGVKWGTAMKKSEQAKGPGAHGMAAGFGIGGGNRIVGGRGGRARVEEEEYGQGIRDEDFERAKNSGNVLKTQTLGGLVAQIESHSPQYMLGTFVENQLHLTPVDSIVQLRPQFHHIDAQAELERMGKAPAIPPSRVQEARAIQMSIKNPVDGEEDNTSSMAERIAATQAEPWRCHNWIDENSDAAWATYRENLLVASGEMTAKELKDEMSQLNSSMTPGEYLDNISAPRDAAKLSRSKHFMKSRTPKKPAKGKGKGKEVAGQVGDSSLDDSSESDVNGAAP